MAIDVTYGLNIQSLPRTLKPRGAFLSAWLSFLVIVKRLLARRGNLYRPELGDCNFVCTVCGTSCPENGGGLQ